MMMKALTALALLLAGAGSAIAADRDPFPLTKNQRADLDKAVAGKVEGKPVTCVGRSLGSDGLRAVSDEMLLYRVSRRLVYINRLSGSCSGISRGNTLVLQPTNDHYCRGDIAWSMDLSIGMGGPSCVLGDFIPYKAEGK